MARKRVAINISLPDEAFKKEVAATNKRLKKRSSEEFVKLYKRLRTKR